MTTTCVQYVKIYLQLRHSHYFPVIIANKTNDCRCLDRLVWSQSVQMTSLPIQCSTDRAFSQLYILEISIKYPPNGPRRAI